MATMGETAKQFFDACETGKGWNGCSEFCQPGATFSAQAGALAGVDTLEGYTDWMKGLFTPVPNGRYELRAFAVDDERSSVTAFAVFHGTHTGEGRAGTTDGKERRGGLRLRHGVRRRQDPPHDEDLERRDQSSAARLDVATKQLRRGDLS